jgi:hypothetical protein
MIQKSDKLLLYALFIGFVFHGTVCFFTFAKTYDAYVHIFFADHYARSWFEPWDNRWYTGFNVTSYPPLVHQLIALLSFVFGLKYAFVFLATVIMQLFIIGAYRFSKLWTTPHVAGYAAIFACFSSSVVEVLHLFGQLPTLMGMACLLNALPEIYRWVRYGKYYRLATALSIMGVGVTSHHVTTIFGVVFFVAPVMGLAVMDSVMEKGKNSIDEQLGLNFNLNNVISKGTPEFRVTIKAFLNETWNKRKELALFMGAVPFIMMLVFPYFYWSKTDPITQVSIPHGSRDSFIEVVSSGIMFFLVPMGIILLILPYIFSRVWARRNIFIGLSFTLLIVLGTGGTTPIPKLMLGEAAFNILTLDRFTFWATMISIPFVGEFFYRLIEGDFKKYLRVIWGVWPHRLTWGFLVTSVAAITIFIINLGTFRPMQPDPVEINPILQFLERDQHSKWRFMTLGFGDQMAWLSAQTSAQSVDGNYHSARRLPEMTTRPLERLENSKFKGIQGLGSLQQFLTIPEKYYLKFIFSNDKFYDPILYFSGWERVQRLENGIMVWQKQDVSPLPNVLPKKNLPKIMKIMWGTLPLITLFMAFAINFLFVWYTRFRKDPFYDDGYQRHFLVLPVISKKLLIFMGCWLVGLLVMIAGVIVAKSLEKSNTIPKGVLIAYYNAIDFKYFGTAYEYFNPENKPSFDEFFIQLSVEDGILASYAKMDKIEVELEEVNKNEYNATVRTEWITPMEQYPAVYKHKVVKVKGDWYIQPLEFDSSIPPDAVTNEPMLRFHAQGKRRVSTRPTRHDDVLDRPELNIISARLIKKDSSYSVVGEIQNIDNLPAHLTIQADLYDEYNRKLVSYNAKYTTIHRILPKETVAFRIDFEQTAWVKESDLDPGKFNPDEFTPFEFSHPPKIFKVLARAVVDKNDIYRSVGVQRVRERGGVVEGEAINYGTEEVSVPKLLIAYYDENDEVKWVETHFIREGIRQQRKRKFKFKLADFSDLEIIRKASSEDLYVNGLLNEFFRDERKKVKRSLIPVGPNEKIDLRVDAFIGSPTIY